MPISILVPVLNEAAQIQPFLCHLRERAPGVQVIVADGGSDDCTAVLASGLCDRVITTSCSRPIQMNAAARIADGDVLWFLHADNQIPIDAIDAITSTFADPQVVGGCFRVKIPRPELIYRVHDGIAHYVGKLLRIRCGDHGIFLRRDVFNEVGGYPDVPLMEDIKMFRAIQSYGRIAWLPERLLLSSRRHVQVGVYRYTFVCAVIVALYCLGVSTRSLARIYSHLVPSRNSPHFRQLQPVEDVIFGDYRLQHSPVSRET